MASPGWLKGLTQRALSALILIPVVIALVWFGGWVAFGGAVLALAIGLWELRRMFAKKGWRPLLALTFASGVIFSVVAVLWHEGDGLASLVLTALLTISGLMTLSFAWLILTRKTVEGALTDWALTVGSAIYLAWPIAFFLLLRGDAAGAKNAGFGWLLAMFFMVWANDTFALLTGHFLGRHKLSPVISPGKTWEGFYGGLFFTICAALVFLLLVPHIFGVPLHIAWYHAVILGALVAIAATIGDLAESLLKRSTGVKDSGAIVPGHGGILDRMDSLLFVVLVVFFYAALTVGIRP
ncbi:MAG TPA: CDP-archaeol synthase [Ktedonobacterales bacterium]|nr:CDP-archaeol synthase [Ktedonobacterales bacterium]